VKITILNDTGGHEARVAATPETVKGYVKSGHSVSVVKNAGAKSDFSDADYKEAGASIVATNTAAAKTADLVMSITGADAKLVAGMKNRASHAPKRWMCCRHNPTSQATAQWLRRALSMAALSR